MGQLWYPGADRSQDRSQFSGVTMSRITKLVLHSTETRGWPGYPGFAPQFTYNPWSHQWRQHMAANRSASTLADPSSTAVRENRDSVVQVEIVGYCDPPMQRKYGYSIQKLDDQAYADLAAFAAWLHREWGLPLRSTVRWVNYPASYGSRAAQRLSGAAYDAYTGILGHQHVSGNDHGDPGVIDAARIVRLASGAGEFAAADSTSPTEGQPLMASAQHIGRVSTTWQDVPAGEGRALHIDDPKPDGTSDLSLVIGETDGADLTVQVEVLGLGPEERASVYFARVFKDNRVDYAFRNPGQVDVVGRYDDRPAAAELRFADPVRAHEPEFRIRVLADTPVPLKVRTRSSGYVIR